MRFVNVIVRVRLPRNVRQQFTYVVPERLAEHVTNGSIVLVSFRGRRVLAVVTGEATENTTTARLLPIIGLLPYAPLSKIQSWLLEHLQTYYGATSTTALITVLPELSRTHKPPAIARTLRKKNPTLPATRAKTPSASAIITGVLPCPIDSFYQEHVRNITTRSGQTLILLPDRDELISTAKAYGDNSRAAAWHGSMNRSETSALWFAIANGEIDVVVGTRSSLFLPFANLKSVLIFYPTADGHRSWDMQPHYDVVELATALSKTHKVQVLVGTVYAPTTLTNLLPTARRTAQASSSIVLLDRNAIAPSERSSPLDSTLLAALQETSTQSLIVVPRRGFAAPICRNCDYTPRCNVCDRLLSYNDETMHQLHCPVCTALVALPTRCPQCGGVDFRLIGTGIERVISWLKKIAPQLVITAASPKVLPFSIRNEAKGVTVSTPFIVPHLWALPPYATIIALRADSYLHAPHWFANEATLHLLSTMAAASQQHFFIDTAQPGHPVFQALQERKIEIFYNAERKDRKQYGYPPFMDVVRIQSKSLPNSFSEIIRQQIPSADITLVDDGLIIRTPPGGDLAPLWALLPPATIVDRNGPALL